MLIHLLTLLLATAAASPLVERQNSKTEVGTGTFGCTYDVFPKGMQVTDKLRYNFNSATSWEDCLAQCDNSTQCAAASYYPHRTDRACIQIDYKSFAVAPLAPAKHAMTAQVRANSCAKKAAKTQKQHCPQFRKLAVILVPETGDNMCQYQVACGQALGTDIPTAFGYYASFEKCVTECDNNPQCYAATFEPGGTCRMGLNFAFINATFTPEAGAQSVALLEGSCGKQAAMGG